MVPWLWFHILSPRPKRSGVGLLALHVPWANFSQSHWRKTSCSDSQHLITKSMGLTRAEPPLSEDPIVAVRSIRYTFGLLNVQVRTLITMYSLCFRLILPDVLATRYTVHTVLCHTYRGAVYSGTHALNIVLLYIDLGLGAMCNKLQKL